jgi:hypothetical protein
MASEEKRWRAPKARILELAIAEGERGAKGMAHGGFVP